MFNVAHQVAVRDAASIHFRPSITRTDISVLRRSLSATIHCMASDSSTSASVFWDGRISTHADPTITRRAIGGDLA